MSTTDKVVLVAVVLVFVTWNVMNRIWALADQLDQAEHRIASLERRAGKPKAARQAVMPKVD